MENKRLIKALSEKMCLLSAIQTENKWVMSMRGESNNVYEQTLTDTSYICSCPDAQGKKTFCKHLLFLTVRVAKQYELGAELAQRPKTTWKKNSFDACSLSWKHVLSHLVKTIHGTPLVTEGLCSICFEDLGSCELLECTSVCHQNFHKICMNRWLEHGNSCPNCRADWIKVDSKKDELKTDVLEKYILPEEFITGSIEESNEISVKNTDIVISFDTTGSMYPCLAEVKRNTTAITERLFREIPSLRVAIIAHGDYCDGDRTILQLDFTSNQEEIKEFIQNAPATNGGDIPECYELVLRNVKLLSWRADATMKSLILIGDAPPHEKNENPYKIDWREEAESLKNRNIQVFSVQCLNRGNMEAFNFYSDLAEITNGYHVFLDQFSYIKDMIQAICFKQYNNDYLEKFEKEMQDGNGGMSNAMRLMFDTMLGKKTRQETKDEMHPKRFKELYEVTSIPKHIHSSKATPSLEHESELKPSPPSRFQIFGVDEDMNIKDFCAKMGIRFSIGRGFYEFTKPEIIQKKKEIILMNKISGELYEGEVARSIAGICDDNSRVKPGELPKYRMFIQSTSPNRKLIAGQGFLYEVE
jgi:Mg-chelatase subunit ChlD